MFLIVKGPNGGFNLRFCTSPRTHHLNWSFHPQRYSWWCHLTSKTAPVSPFNPRVQVQLLQFIVGRWQQPRLTAHHGWNLCLKALWQHTYHRKYVYRITFRQKKKTTKVTRPTAYQNWERSRWNTVLQTPVAWGVSPCWRSSSPCHLQSEGGSEPISQTGYCCPFYSLHSWSSSR